jgi:hypothetical protein
MTFPGSTGERPARRAVRDIALKNPGPGGMIYDVPDEGQPRVAEWPPVFDVRIASRARSWTPAPGIGQHSRAILAE